MSTSEDVRKDNVVINRGSAPEGVRKINDMLYEIYTDGNVDSEVIVIFFHGLIRSREVDQGRNNIHVSTWTSKEEVTESEVLWPHRRVSEISYLYGKLGRHHKSYRNGW